MRSKNHLGRFGERVVSLLFQRRINGEYRFWSTFLGEKAEAVDFIVHLLDSKGAPYGPYFFVQVKTTAASPTQGNLVPARFSAGEVEGARARGAPVYLIAVECLDEDSEEVYVLPIDESLPTGVSGVPRIYSLKDKETRLQIYREVHAYFESHPSGFRSALNCESRRKNSGTEEDDEQS